MVSDVQVRGLGAAGVVHPVLPAAEILHHPLAALHEVTQVRAVAVLGSLGHHKRPLHRNNTKLYVTVLESIFNKLVYWFLITFALASHITN